MERLQIHIGWAVIASQTTHIFCCGLPALFSILSLLSGFGLIGILPSSFSGIHEVLHEWEHSILILSGSILVLGWTLQAYSRRLDCTTTSCVHASCKPKKKTSSYILLGATFLFLINIIIYGLSGHQ